MGEQSSISYRSFDQKPFVRQTVLVHTNKLFSTDIMMMFLQNKRVMRKRLLSSMLIFALALGTVQGSGGTSNAPESTTTTVQGSRAEGSQGTVKKPGLPRTPNSRIYYAEGAPKRRRRLSSRLDEMENL